jgi:uncharacterized membrane-anchored protein
VSDEDANGYDYTELMRTMQADQLADNQWRTENDYQTINLIGWAAPPHYEQATRQLYWAKQLRFAGDPADTLNYDIRSLGRHGVLILSFIAGMDQLAEIEEARPDVLQMVSFTTGNRYADFLPGVDTVAAVGIGGLIAGKVLANTGLLAVVLLFAKKFAVLLLIPILAIKRFFTGRKNGS